MEDILEERAFDEESNDWRKSGLREYLNNYFYETLTDYDAEEKDFLMIETDLTADDGMKDYGTSKDLISLMTADLYRSNRHLLKPLGSWWWLATPYSYLASSSYYVRSVYSSGSLSYFSIQVVIFASTVAAASPNLLKDCAGLSLSFSSNGAISSVTARFKKPKI